MVTMMAKKLERAVAIDSWIADYGGESNPGPDTIRADLAALDVDCSKVALMTGDSHDILPSLKDKFNLILVDGDHSYGGAEADLRDCVKLLERGGLLVFDDASDFLLSAWRATTGSWHRFMREEHLDTTPPWCGATRL
jgi:SAM-dependent methyltransferase